LTPSVTRRVFAIVIVMMTLLSGCASHAPKVDCDTRLAPINVGETLKPATVHKNTATAEGLKP
jgi:hypothetical protein